MPQSPRPDRPGQRPSDRTPPPDDVTDRLLWALAVDVAAAHRPGPDGSCTNLQCRGQDGPCWALHTARRAAHLARRATTNRPVRGLTAPRTTAVLPRRVARGRAAVTPVPDRFTNWFGTRAALATPSTTAPAPKPASVPVTVSTAYAPFRRPAVAAVAA